LTEKGVKECDAVIIGDGSGSGWEIGCGFAATLIDLNLNTRQEFHGGFSAGTNHLGEFFAYIVPMQWYTVHHGLTLLKDRQKRQTGKHPQVNICCICDNKTIVDQGNRRAERGSWQALWSTWNTWASHGFFTTWVWCPREELGLNVLADDMSRQSRIAMQNIQIPAGVDLHTLNPSPPVTPAS
jgi:hypothetical protein